MNRLIMVALLGLTPLSICAQVITGVEKLPTQRDIIEKPKYIENSKFISSFAEEALYQYSGDIDND